MGFCSFYCNAGLSSLQRRENPNKRYQSLRRDVEEDEEQTSECPNYTFQVPSNLEHNTMSVLLVGKAKLRHLVNRTPAHTLVLAQSAILVGS